MRDWIDPYRDSKKVPRGVWVTLVITYLILGAVVLYTKESAHVDWDVWRWALGRWGL